MSRLIQSAALILSIPVLWIGSALAITAAALIAVWRLWQQ